MAARTLPGQPNFGPNVYVFTPSMPQSQIQATVNVKGFQPAKMGVAQYGVFEDAVGVGPTTYDLALTGPTFLFIFPSYSITVLTLQP